MIIVERLGPAVRRLKALAVVAMGAAQPAPAHPDHRRGAPNGIYLAIGTMRIVRANLIGMLRVTEAVPA